MLVYVAPDVENCDWKACTGGMDERARPWPIIYALGGPKTLVSVRLNAQTHEEIVEALVNM